MNPEAIEGHLRLVLIEWMIIVAVAWIFGRLGKRMGQPLAVGEIFAGLLLGPSALGLVWPQKWSPLFPNETQQSLQLLGKLGIILLLFQVGMEFDFGHLRNRSRTVALVSISGIVVPVIGGLCIGPWLHSHFAASANYLGFQLFICIALSITALPIMGRILLEMGLARTSMGALAISAAAIDDVVGWIGLAVVTALAQSDFQWGPVFVQTGGIIALFFFLWWVARPGIAKLWKISVPPHPNGQPPRMPASVLAVLLIAVFACAFATSQLRLFTFFGAFIMGVVLHEQVDLVRAWREQMSNFVLVALVPIFFTNTGLRTEIGSLKTLLAWVGCALVLFVASAGKLGGCYAAARVMGQGKAEAFSIAALMNTRALMGLVAINVGFDLKLLPKELFTMFVIMALLTTAMTGPILNWCLPADLRKLVPELAGRPARRPKNENRHAISA
jgi:Kef-type K+ transport system membrane component KefB